MANQVSASTSSAVWCNVHHRATWCTALAIQTKHFGSAASGAWGWSYFPQAMVLTARTCTAFSREAPQVCGPLAQAELPTVHPSHHGVYSCWSGRKKKETQSKKKERPLLFLKTQHVWEYGVSPSTPSVFLPCHNTSFLTLLKNFSHLGLLKGHSFLLLH